MLRSSDLDWTRARSRNGRGHQFLRPQLDTVIPTAGITSSTAMFAYTPVLGNDALGIPLALVRGHCRHPARITKCPLDATSITSSKEPHHQSRKVICVGHVRSAGTTVRLRFPARQAARQAACGRGAAAVGVVHLW